MPVGGQPLAVFVDEHHAPGQLVEGAERDVPLDLERRHPAIHPHRALQMWQHQATAFDVVVAECGRFPRAHDFEKHGSRLFTRQHGAKPVMQVLRLQPLGVKFCPHKFVLGHELLANVNCPGRPVIAFPRQPNIVTSIS